MCSRRTPEPHCSPENVNPHSGQRGMVKPRRLYPQRGQNTSFPCTSSTSHTLARTQGVACACCCHPPTRRRKEQVAPRSPGDVPRGRSRPASLSAAAPDYPSGYARGPPGEDLCISKTPSGPHGTADTGAIEPIGADTPRRSTSRTLCNGRRVHVGAGPPRQVRSAPLTA